MRHFFPVDAPLVVRDVDALLLQVHGVADGRTHLADGRQRTVGLRHQRQEVGHGEFEDGVNLAAVFPPIGRRCGCQKEEAQKHDPPSSGEHAASRRALTKAGRSLIALPGRRSYLSAASER